MILLVSVKFGLIMYIKCQIRKRGPTLQELLGKVFFLLAYFCVLLLYSIQQSVDPRLGGFEAETQGGECLRGCWTKYWVLHPGFQTLGVLGAADLDSFF